MTQDGGVVGWKCHRYNYELCLSRGKENNKWDLIIVNDGISMIMGKERKFGKSKLLDEKDGLVYCGIVTVLMEEPGLAEAGYVNHAIVLNPSAILAASPRFLFRPELEDTSPKWISTFFSWKRISGYMLNYNTKAR